MCKNLKTPAAECLENGNYHMYRKLFYQSNIFEKIPSVRKMQEPRNKQNQIKGTELSYYVHHIKLTCHSPLTPDQYNAENPKSPKQKL